MPNNPKCFIHGTVIEVTFRTEEGLPLVPTDYMRLILLGIITRAQSLFPVTICHFVVMSNHIHMILVVQDPAAVKDFVGAVKRESAHAVNHLLGRRKHTIWCDGYDSAVILDPEKVVERIVYIYTNPQKANLEETIDRYPNLTTWDAFLKGGLEQTVRRIPRCCIPKLPKTTLSAYEQKRFSAKLLDRSMSGGVLLIEPDAWLDCFAETRDADPTRYKQEIVAKIRAEERRLAQARTQPVLGAITLRTQTIDVPFIPKKYGLRMVCLSTLKELRIAFLSWFKKQCSDAADAALRWKNGEALAMPPPGFFLPGGFLRSNVNPGAVFLERSGTLARMVY